LFSYLLGKINVWIEKSSAEEFIKQHQMEEFEKWLVGLDRVGGQKHIDYNEIVFMTKYMNAHWRNNVYEIDKNTEFAVQLPPKLRQKLLDTQIITNIKSCFEQFFTNLEPAFIRKLICRLQYTRYYTKFRNKITAEEVFVKAGEIPNFIYFLMSGVVGVYSFNEMQLYMNLENGAVFGDQYVIYDIPASYTIKFDPFEMCSKAKFIEVYKIDKKDFYEIVKDYEKTYNLLKIEALRKRRVYRKIKQKSISAILGMHSRKSSSENFSKIEEKNSQEIKFFEDEYFKITSERNLTEHPLISNMTNREKSDNLAGFTGVYNILNSSNETPVLTQKSIKHTKNYEIPEETHKIYLGVTKFDQIMNGITTKNLNHAELLNLESEYDSENEFGENDYFYKKCMIKNPYDTISHIREIRSEIRKMSRNLDEMDRNIENVIEKYKNKVSLPTTMVSQ